MRRHPIGYRYAYALFEIARDQETLTETLEELETVSQVLKDTKLFDKVFSNPKMTDDEKKKILTDTFSKHVGTSVLHLLLLIIDKKRESVFQAVADNFKELVYEEKGIAEATVYSAKPLSEQERAAVISVFAKRAGKAKLLIDNVVDEEIIGGLKVHIGDTVYDGSVANQLARIQTRMIHGNVSR
ncbi:F0F1 ATP synthase subunit delta [Salipaludibacillus neizhouensis]|uniref:ATP synthase subunit delta n=1 Tax=Salipaludibacillus neizhouensis TaxID=885475 RepID=A0A3A9KTR4_9BACI|nr:F0F1 ATP synthase subunit delta [Salipaludibacillus neizhouensis]RKL68006.1 F0F1 ATP synthase subunit delta [Salipaludibacillus neizhouensis]